ncbi:hypothetical protein E2C01_041163 [Portunus trituberculatus]|uniref:Uncharacterized protein n=1 Tax=Portunus trituberculatus TaxID=210409 RepID=A0A5B7FQ74_PORTR|nr:hypothetical protein [Portunus trituberculatus]
MERWRCIVLAVEQVLVAGGWERRGNPGGKSYVTSADSGRCSYVTMRTQCHIARKQCAVCRINRTDRPVRSRTSRERKPKKATQAWLSEGSDPRQGI